MIRINLIAVERERTRKRGVHVREPGGNYSKVHVTMLRALGIETPSYGFSGGETSDALAGVLV